MPKTKSAAIKKAEREFLSDSVRENWLSSYKFNGKQKDRPPYPGLESKFSIDFYQLCVYSGLLAIHVSNEAPGGKSWHGIQKAMGVTRGASDYVIFNPKIYVNSRGVETLYHGAVIELKVQGKKPTDHQLEFLDKAHRQRYLAFWLENFDAAEEFVNYYSKLKSPF